MFNYTEFENPINLSSDFDTSSHNNVDFIPEIRNISLKNEKIHFIRKSS